MTHPELPYSAKDAAPLDADGYLLSSDLGSLDASGRSFLGDVAPPSGGRGAAAPRCQLGFRRLEDRRA
jgi:hypothetical protein